MYIFKNTGNQIGFFAHKLQETFNEYPELVNNKKDDISEDGQIKAQSIEMPTLNIIMMKAIQEQNVIIKNILKENEDLKSRLSAIESRMNGI
jgi:hypothetical protein